MVNISKRKLKKDILNKINNKLIETIYKLDDKKSINLFLNDLLTYSEKVVLIKRLSIIFMLYEGLSGYRIHMMLNVSQATVLKIAVKIDKGGYENILKIVKQKKNRATFWAGMEMVLQCGMPPIVGKGRWSFLDELYGKYNLKK
ncbi:MAG: hypothetical protein KAV41_02845 [Candidatus Pacebacteria bacterium]|nr:hypothetical protein [Candidatus Paceibacterota bacterium]